MNVQIRHIKYVTFFSLKFRLCQMSVSLQLWWHLKFITEIYYNGTESSLHPVISYTLKLKRREISSTSRTDRYLHPRRLSIKSCVSLAHDVCLLSRFAQLVLSWADNSCMACCQQDVEQRFRQCKLRACWYWCSDTNEIGKRHGIIACHPPCVLYLRILMNFVQGISLWVRLTP